MEKEHIWLCSREQLNRQTDHIAMKQRAIVFIPRQTPGNFLSVYMAGSLSIVELDLWCIQLMLNFGIVFFGSNDNPIASNGNLRQSVVPFSV
ncbi:MAG: hypothetical protein ACR2QJ_02155 [Geminicoccaceae bacterium]